MIVIVPSLSLLFELLPALIYLLVPFATGVWTGTTATVLWLLPSHLKQWDLACIPALICMGFIMQRRWQQARYADDDADGPSKASHYGVLLVLIMIFISGLVMGGQFGKEEVATETAKLDLKQPANASKDTDKKVANATAPAVSIPAKSKIAIVSGQTPPKEIAAVMPLLKLKSIIGSEQRRTALINNTPLSVGESTVIKTEGKSIKVKCLDITDKSVRLELEGNPELVELSME